MRRSILLLVAALTLTACKVDASVLVTMEPDGTGSISLTLTADKEMVTAAPGLADDLRFDDAASAGWTVTGPTATADGGLQAVLVHTFATVEEATALLKSMNGPGGPLHDVAITRTVTSKEITSALTGVLKVDGGLDAFADSDLLTAIGGSPYADRLKDGGVTAADVVSFTLTADLPGKITSAGTGTKATTGPGLTWTATMDGATTDLSSVFVQQQGQPSSGWGFLAKAALVLLIAWVIFAVCFIAFVAKARRQRALRRLAARR